jgi:hypothetical protein
VVVDAGAARGMGGVKGTVLDVAEAVGSGAAREAAEFGGA